MLPPLFARPKISSGLEPELGYNGTPPCMSKKTKFRDCPAVGRQIKSLECGENRHRAYACPADCPHSPFSLGNYDQFGDIEDNLDIATIARALDDPEIGPPLRKVPSRPGDRNWVPTVVSLFFATQGKDGLLFSERWEKAGLPDLRGDERLLLSYKRQVRVALLEVQQVIDHETVSVIDLLEHSAEPTLVVDRSFASMALRFDRILAIAYPAPNYLRLLGSIIQLPSVPGLSPRQVFEQTVRHLGGQIERIWLLNNAERLFATVSGVAAERDRLALLASDMVSAQLDYELKAPLSKLQPKLRKRGFVADMLDPDEKDDGWEQAYILVASPENAKPDQLELLGETYLGHIALKDGRARLAASSQANKSALVEAFEKACGNDASLLGEYVSDTAASKALKTKAPATGSLPEGLLRDIGQYTLQSSRFDLPEDANIDGYVTVNAIETYYRKLLDQPVPQLSGQTPRQAAGDLFLRPALVEWTKGLVRSVDSQNLFSGSSADIGWIFAELGLAELDFPAPPPRPVPTRNKSAGPDLAPEFDEDFDDEYDSLESEMDELEDYLKDRLSEYDTAGAAMADMLDQGCTLLDDLSDATAELISDEKFDVLVTLLILAWLAVVPPGQRVAMPRGCVLRETERFLRESQTLTQADMEAPDFLERLCQDTLLLSCLIARLDAVQSTLPKRLRFTPKDSASATAILAIAINSLISARDNTIPFRP